MPQADPTQRAALVAARVAEVWRADWGRLLALLVAQYRRLDLAEDALSDAFEAAVRHWPTSGIPDNPAAWLLTAARRRALDRIRAEAVATRKQPLLVVDATLREQADRTMADPADLLHDDVVPDDLLRLVMLCAHPALAPEAAAALSLRLVVGVTTRDIARLFLVTEPTMAARITRARKKLVVAGAPFAIPSHAALPGRVEVVGQVAYLAFTAGYAPGAGPDLVRLDLAGEAVRLADVLHGLVPADPLPTALLALMLLQHSRRDARVDEVGALVLLPDQDRSRWRRDEIARALTLLSPLLAAPVRPAAQAYLLQALIAAEHATAATAGDTNWVRIADLYADLDHLTGSPVVRLNRAVAVAEAHGPRVAMALLDGLDEPLAANHRLPAVRAELLVRIGGEGSLRAAADAYEESIALCSNEIERQHLQQRRDAVEGSTFGLSRPRLDPTDSNTVIPCAQPLPSSDDSPSP